MRLSMWSDSRAALYSAGSVRVRVAQVVTGHTLVVSPVEHFRRPANYCPHQSLDVTLLAAIPA